MITITARWLRRHLAGIVGWAIGLALLGFALVALYDPYQRDSIVHQTVQALPKRVVDVLGLGELSDPQGFVRAAVFGVLGITVCLVAGIGYGAAALASDERDGILEPELSRAVSRTQVYWARLAGLVAVIAVLGVAITGAAALAGSLLHVPAPATAVAGWGLALTAIVAVHGLVSFGVGAMTGSPGAARLTAALVAVGGYVGHVAQDSDQGRWVFSLLLTPGDPAGSTALLAGLGAAATAVLVGWLVFLWRDLRVVRRY